MDSMREITGEIVVCLQCGLAYEQPEGGSTEMPCGAHLCTHYPPEQWTHCLCIADELAKSAPRCQAQECPGCRHIGRMTERRNRHMPVQV